MYIKFEAYASDLQQGLDDRSTGMNIARVIMASEIRLISDDSKL